MDLADQERKKVTLPGQAGHQGAWDKGSIREPASEISPEITAAMREQDILRQIGEQGFNQIDDIVDRIAEAILRNPELANDPQFQSRAEAARNRLNELVGQTLH